MKTDEGTESLTLSSHKNSSGLKISFINVELVPVSLDLVPDVCSFFPAHLGRELSQVRHWCRKSETLYLLFSPFASIWNEIEGHLSMLLFYFPFLTRFPLHFKFGPSNLPLTTDWWFSLSFAPCHGMSTFTLGDLLSRLSNSIYWPFLWLQICSCHSFHLLHFFLFRLLA